MIWKFANDFDSSPGLILCKLTTLLEGIDFMTSSIYFLGIFSSEMISILLFFANEFGRKSLKIPFFPIRTLYFSSPTKTFLTIIYF